MSPLTQGLNYRSACDLASVIVNELLIFADDTQIFGRVENEMDRDRYKRT